MERSITSRVVGAALALALTLTLLVGSAHVVGTLHTPGDVFAFIAERSDVYGVLHLSDSGRTARLAPHADALAWSHDCAPSRPRPCAARLAWLTREPGDDYSRAVWVWAGAERIPASRSPSSKFSLVWSPTGQLAWVSLELDRPPSVWVWDGADVRLAGEHVTHFALSWSPSGVLAWTSTVSGSEDIWAWDGTHPVNLSQHPERDFAPAWSPRCDGHTPLVEPAANAEPCASALAWLATRAGRTSVVVRDGDALPRVVSRESADANDAMTALAWSPDGWLTWADADPVNGASRCLRYTVYVWDGTNTRALFTRSATRLYGLAWSPGRRLAWHEVPCSRNATDVLVWHAGTIAPLVAGGVAVDAFAWQP